MRPYRIVNKKTGEEITNFSTINPNAAIDTRIGPFNRWKYTVGVIYTGMFAVGHQLNDQRFLDYPIRNYDFIFEHLPYFRGKARKHGLERDGYHPINGMHTLDDCGSIGVALIQTYEIELSLNYPAMIDTVANFITKSACLFKEHILSLKSLYNKSYKNTI